MLAVWVIARAQLRRRRGATVALVLLMGLAGGVVLAAVAGASRTDTAMKRFVAYSRPEDVFVIVNGSQGDPSDPAVFAQALATRRRVLGLPQVAEVGRAPYLFLTPDKTGAEFATINPFGAADAHAFRTLDRPLLLQGRFPRLDRPGEAMVDDLTVVRRHLHIGSKVRMWAFSAQQNQAVNVSGAGKIPAPAGPGYTFRVVGIVRDPTTVNALPTAVVRDASYQSQGDMVLTPAFLRRFAQDQGLSLEGLPGMEGFRIRLRHGLADLPAFERDVRRAVSPGDGQIHLGSDIQTAADKAQRPIHLEAIALAVFAGLAALAALLVVGQALGRQVGADTRDNPTLAALGARRRQLVLVPLVRAAIIAVGGGATAVVVAAALSPLTPIGLARRAEIHPGFSINLAVLVLGSVSVAALVLLRALLPAWRAARTLSEDALDQAPAKPGPLLAAVAGAGLGPAAVAGVGMSFERGRGRAFRTALLGTLVAVTGVVAAVTFGVSLRHLVDRPAEQGWNWDVVVGNPHSSEGLAGDPAGDLLHQEMVRRLAANRYVGSFSGLALTDGITLDGHQVDIAGVETDKGSVFGRIIEGRAPGSPDEIVLGRDALAQVHKRIGQTVTARAGDRRSTMRIVGASLQPTAGDLSPRLSRGGAVTVAALQRLGLDARAFQFAVRYRPGVDTRAASNSLLDDFGREVLRPYPGGEVGDLARVDFLPYVLAGLLVVLAVGAMALTLIASVRRHRRDLAILKTIGFVRGQIFATVAWQATALAAGALVVGLPCGVALGRWTWDLVAGGVGSVSPPIVPLTSLLAVAAATLLVANLLAGGPGWAAGRVPPAEVLRSE
jgi:hypothetical protein